MLSNHLILCCPLLLLPSMFFSIRVFFTDLALPMRRPKYLNFSISSSINVQGWFPLVQSLLLSKELWRLFSSTTIQKHQFISARFSLMVCLSYLYMTIGKITALAVWTFVDKVMSAILNLKRWCCESAALNMPEDLENSAVATGLEKVSFHSSPKEKQCQRMFKLLHNCTHLTC